MGGLHLLCSSTHSNAYLVSSLAEHPDRHLFPEFLKQNPSLDEEEYAIADIYQDSFEKLEKLVSKQHAFNYPACQVIGSMHARGRIGYEQARRVLLSDPDLQVCFRALAAFIDGHTEPPSPPDRRWLKSIVSDLSKMDSVDLSVNAFVQLFGKNRNEWFEGCSPLLYLLSTKVQDACWRTRFASAYFNEVDVEANTKDVWHLESVFSIIACVPRLGYYGFSAWSLNPIKNLIRSIDKFGDQSNSLKLMRTLVRYVSPSVLSEYFWKALAPFPDVAFAAWIQFEQSNHPSKWLCRYSDESVLKRLSHTMGRTFRAVRSRTQAKYLWVKFARKAGMQSLQMDKKDKKELHITLRSKLMLRISNLPLEIVMLIWQWIDPVSMYDTLQWLAIPKWKVEIPPASKPMCFKDRAKNIKQLDIEGGKELPEALSGLCFEKLETLKLRENDPLVLEELLKVFGSSATPSLREIKINYSGSMFEGLQQALETLIKNSKSLQTIKLQTFGYCDGMLWSLDFLGTSEADTIVLGAIRPRKSELIRLPTRLKRLDLDLNGFTSQQVLLRLLNSSEEIKQVLFRVSPNSRGLLAGLELSSRIQEISIIFRYDRLNRPLSFPDYADLFRSSHLQRLNIEVVAFRVAPHRFAEVHLPRVTRKLTELQTNCPKLTILSFSGDAHAKSCKADCGSKCLTIDGGLGKRPQELEVIQNSDSISSDEIHSWPSAIRRAG